MIVTRRTKRPLANRLGSKIAGASLLEALFAGTIFVCVIAGIVPLYTRAIENYSRASESVDLQVQMEQDLSMIQQLGETYSWCSGAGSVTPSGATCTSQNRNSVNYYVPSNSDGATSTGTELASFTAACSGGSGSSDPLTAALVSTINNQQQPTGLNRTVSLDDATTHRLKLTYTGTNYSRTLVYTPVVASWCP